MDPGSGPSSELEPPVVPPEDTTNDNDSQSNSVLQALKQLSAEMASVKSQLTESRHKGHNRPSSDTDESELSSSEGEHGGAREHTSDDSNSIKAKNTTPSIDTRIETLIASNDKTSQKMI